MDNRPAIDQRDVQIMSDIRLMALSLQKLTASSSNKARIRSATTQIIRSCEDIIARGPPEYRHIIERTAPLEEVERAMRSTLNCYAGKAL